MNCSDFLLGSTNMRSKKASFDPPSLNYITLIQSAIKSVAVDHFSQMLSVIDQGAHKSTIPSLLYQDPQYYWIFKNAEFQQWTSTRSQTLWLLGPSRCNIYQISSYLLDSLPKIILENRSYVLYFFCSTATEQKSPAISFVHTLLLQILNFSSPEQKALIIGHFLHTLFHSILERSRKNKERIRRRFKENGSFEDIIKGMLSDAAIWDALRAVLDDHNHKLLIVVDGIDKIERQRAEFVQEVRAVIGDLPNRNAKIMSLITSQPDDRIKEVLNGLPCIEYDKERKGWL